MTWAEIRQICDHQQWQTDFCEFQTSLVYIESSRIAKSTERNPASQEKLKKTLQEKELLGAASTHD